MERVKDNGAKSVSLGTIEGEDQI